MQYQNSFVSESRQLRSKGQQLSQLHQIYKTLGLVTTGVSGLALITSGGALLPLIAGLVAYGGSVLSENQRTRKLDRKSTRLNSSHPSRSRMPSSA